MQETFVTLNIVKVNGKQCLQSLVTVSELVHGTIVNGIPLKLILLVQDLIIPRNNVLGIRLQQVEHSNIEFLVPFHSLGIVKDRSSQLAVLNIHILEPVSVFGGKQLVKEDLFEEYALNVEHGNHAVIVALVTHHVVAVTLLLVHVDVLVYHCLGRSHF